MAKIKNSIFSASLEVEMTDFHLSLIIEDLEEEGTEEAKEQIKQISECRGVLKLVVQNL